MTMLQTKPFLAAVALAVLFIATKSRAALPDGINVRSEIAPSEARPGTVVELRVTVGFPAGWVLYDVSQVPGSVLPTRIDLTKSDDFVPLDRFVGPTPIEEPSPRFHHRVVRYFTKPTTFQRSIILAPDSQPNRIQVSGTLDFQVCDPQSGRCHLIKQHPFSAEVSVREMDQEPENDAPQPRAQNSPRETKSASIPDLSFAPIEVAKVDKTPLRPRRQEPSDPEQTPEATAEPQVETGKPIAVLEIESSGLRPSFLPSSGPAETPREVSNRWDGWILSGLVGFGLGVAATWTWRNRMQVGS